MKILGIDPGLKGGLAFVDGGKCSHYKMPLCAKKVDVKKLKSIIEDEKPDIVIVEKQFILKWQRGNMVIATNYGRILSILELLDAKHKVITAKSWQKKLKVSGEKKEHINKALSLKFPVPRNSNRKNSVYNDGIADAYCIAYSHTVI